MQFFSYLINGISLGSVYALIALGYTMVYGIAKMLNFAHGDVIMIGSYVVYFAFGASGLNPVLSIVLSMIVCTILGVVIERLAYRPLREAPSLAVLITAIGVSYLLQQVAQLSWSSNPKSFTSVVSGMKPVSLFGGQLTISAETIVTIVACVVIMVVLMWFVNYTPAGLADLRYRLRPGGYRRCAALLLLPHAAAHHRRYAWYQGFRGGCFRRYRLDPRRIRRRHPAGHHREPQQSLHFYPAV